MVILTPHTEQSGSGYPPTDRRSTYSSDLWSIGGSELVVWLTGPTLAKNPRPGPVLDRFWTTIHGCIWAEHMWLWGPSPHQTNDAMWVDNYWTTTIQELIRHQSLKFGEHVYNKTFTFSVICKWIYWLRLKYFQEIQLKEIIKSILCSINSKCVYIYTHINYVLSYE